MAIYDDFSQFFDLKRHTGEIGLEIETEAKQVYETPAMKLWKVTIDDSGRGPCPREYVLKVPLKYADINKAIDEFKEKTAHADFDEKSFTTSTHVHLNVLNESYTTLGNYLTIYALTENLLKHFAGESRVSNLFCLPLCDAEENYYNILNILGYIEQKAYGHVQLDMGQHKYAALNLCALSKYGSLEVRLLRGSTDPKLIHDWISILYRIMEYSRQKMTPKEFISNWKNKGSELLKDIFGPYHVLLRSPREEKLLDQNFWYAANIAMRVKDWNALDSRPLPKKMNAGNIDEIAQAVYNLPFNDLPEDAKHQVIKNFKFFDEAVLANKKPFKKLKAKGVPGGENLAPIAAINWGDLALNAAQGQPPGAPPMPGFDEVQVDEDFDAGDGENGEEF